MSEQMEKTVLMLAQKFEAFSKDFVVALEHSSHQGPPQWYAPKALFLRVVRVAAIASPVEFKFLLCAAHGAIDCLGISGTVKLVLELRRKSARNQKGKKPESVVPGVRNGSGSNKG